MAVQCINVHSICMCRYIDELHTCMNSICTRDDIDNLICDCKPKIL